jgi:hypothetical protein
MATAARRHAVRLATAAFLTIAAAGPQSALAQAPASGSPADPALIEDLVVANHILTDQRRPTRRSSRFTCGRGTCGSARRSPG